MSRCSLSAPKTFAPGPMKSSVPPTCPKSALSPLPLIRQLPPLTTTRIRDEKCYASGASRHQPSLTLVVAWLVPGASLPAQTGDNEPPPGFVALFNGKDLSGWKVPEGDGGHWKVIDGVIDYDAQSEARRDKSLWSEREFGDFELHVDWRIKEAPYTNRNVPYILPDGTH